MSSAHCRQAVEFVVPECLNIEDGKTLQGTAKCLCWKVVQNMISAFKALRVHTDSAGVEQSCLNAIGFTTPLLSTNKGAKGACLATFVSCKQSQDSAISLINACQDSTTKIKFSDFRQSPNNTQQKSPT